MSRIKKQTKNGQFIEQQLDELKNQQLKSIEIVETAKDAFADEVETTIESNKENVFNSDYFAEAFRKIDADRISTQIEFDKIDEEIEAEESAKQLGDENKKRTLIEDKMKQIQKILEIGLEKYKEEHKVIGYKQKVMNAIKNCKVVFIID